MIPDNNPMTSNFQQIREHGLLKADTMLDRGDWSFNKRGEIVARFKNKVAGNQTGRYKEIRKPLPTPLETRLALQSRLLIADHERGVPLNHAPKKPASLNFVLLVETKNCAVTGIIVGKGFREEFSIVKRSCNLKVAKIRARVARVCGDAAALELQQAIVNLYK